MLLASSNAAAETEVSQPLVYGYVRSGAVRPRRESETIEPQQIAIRAWAGRSVRQVSVWPPDLGVPTTIPLFNRPRGRDLWATVRAGDTIVAARFDRLFGTPEDAHACLTQARQTGVHICALDIGGGNLKLEQSAPALAILLAVATTKYRHSLDQKVIKQGQAERRRFRGGHVPFGFRVADKGTLVRDEVQQAFIAQLRQMRQEGMTYDELEKFARAQDHRLTGPGIHKILARSN